jgi:hypothetical protein
MRLPRHGTGTGSGLEVHERMRAANTINKHKFLCAAPFPPKGLSRHRVELKILWISGKSGTLVFPFSIPNKFPLSACVLRARMLLILSKSRLDVLGIVASSGAAEENREGRFKTNKLTLTNCRTWKAGKYAKMSCAKTKSTIYGWLVALFETKIRSSRDGDRWLFMQ